MSFPLSVLLSTIDVDGDLAVVLDVVLVVPSAASAVE